MSVTSVQVCIKPWDEEQKENFAGGFESKATGAGAIQHFSNPQTRANLSAITALHAARSFEAAHISSSGLWTQHNMCSNFCEFFFFFWKRGKRKQRDILTAIVFRGLWKSWHANYLLITEIRHTAFSSVTDEQQTHTIRQINGLNEFAAKLFLFQLTGWRARDEKKSHTANKINEAQWIVAEMHGFLTSGSAKSLIAQKGGAESNCDATSV